MAKAKSKSDKRPDMAALDAIAEEAKLDDRQAQEDRLDRMLNEPSSFGYVRNETEKDLGERIRDARTLAKLTQGELAERTKLADKDGIGISRNVISFIESGRTQPGPKEIRMLCEVLRITPNRLIYGEDSPIEELTPVRFGGHSEIENFAFVAYCFSKLHHNHRDSLYHIMMDLIRPWNKDFDAELHSKAVQTFITYAKELERLEKLKADRSKV